MSPFSTTKKSPLFPKRAEPNPGAHHAMIAAAMQGIFTLPGKLTG